jgi:hypothetical protein
VVRTGLARRDVRRIMESDRARCVPGRPALFIGRTALVLLPGFAWPGLAETPELLEMRQEFSGRCCRTDRCAVPRECANGRATRAPVPPVVDLECGTHGRPAAPPQSRRRDCPHVPRLRYAEPIRTAFVGGDLGRRLRDRAALSIVLARRHRNPAGTFLADDLNWGNTECLPGLHSNTPAILHTRQAPMTGPTENWSIRSAGCTLQTTAPTEPTAADARSCSAARGAWSAFARRQTASSRAITLYKPTRLENHAEGRLTRPLRQARARSLSTRAPCTRR